MSFLLVLIFSPFSLYLTPFFFFSFSTAVGHRRTTTYKIENLPHRAVEYRCAQFYYSVLGELCTEKMVVLLEELVKSLEMWLKLINRKSKQQKYVDPTLDPVLLVPGVAGSILHAVDEKTGKKERVWVRILGADHEFRTKLWSSFDPSTGKLLNVLGFSCCKFLRF